MSEDEKYWRERPANDTRLDWRNNGGSWVDEYISSADHPHRDLILKAIEKHFTPLDSILEVGCNAGPNLLRIVSVHPNADIAGIDVSEPAITKAKEILPEGEFKVASGTHIPFSKDYFEVGLADAVLMYADPHTMHRIAREFQRVLNKGLILVEWYDESKEGVIKDHHWARDYGLFMQDYGFTCVEEKQLTETDWPHKTWHTHGRLFVFKKV